MFADTFYVFEYSTWWLYVFRTPKIMIRSDENWCVCDCRMFTLYARSLPLDIASRAWDVFFRDGEEFLFRMALGEFKYQYVSATLRRAWLPQQLRQFLSWFLNSTCVLAGSVGHWLCSSSLVSVWHWSVSPSVLKLFCQLVLNVPLLFSRVVPCDCVL